MFVYDKSRRLLTRSEFLRLANNSTKLVTTHFIILIGKTVNQFPRLGVTVSKKIGNSVTRNRVKRLIREYFRRNMGDLPAFDYNIIARSEAGYLCYTAVCQELANALSRVGQRHNR